MTTNGNNEENNNQSTALSGQSVSTSDTNSLGLNNLDILLVGDDDAESQGCGKNTNKKKKKRQRVSGQDNNGRGLRQFSIKVCEKVQSKGTTTHNEVADELVAEYASPINNGISLNPYDEKNIRRRVYDALNVLMAMGIISKNKKEIQWKGLPRTTSSHIEDLKTEKLSRRKRIDKKTAYFQELVEQDIGLQNLIQRNQHLFSSGNAPSGGVALPFILVQTIPHAKVEVEISEDMHLVHLDFNSTPFELHDDNFVLKTLKFNDQPPQPKRHMNSQICISPEEGPTTGPAAPAKLK